MKYDVLAAHKHCFHNRAQLQESHICGCFHCRRIYVPEKITKWCDKWGVTALCPHCGIDSVIAETAGYPLNAEFLEEMHRRWFGSEK